MFIRPCYRRKDGKRHAYWALVASYRGARGPRQRTVAYLGQLDQAGCLGVQQAATGRHRQRQLFDGVEPRWVQVDLQHVYIKQCLEFGGPWLAQHLLDRLGLSTLFDRLMGHGREEIAWSVIAQVLVIARFCDPSSELYVAEHSYQRTALCDVLGLAVADDLVGRYGTPATPFSVKF